MKKFVCDQMCSHLGRWLRIAGYDTVIIETSIPDEKIYKSAMEQQRFLLTRDRLLKESDPEQKTIIYLRSENLDNWAKQLKDENGVDWLYFPFSRCLQCNSELIKTSRPKDDQEIYKDIAEFWICPACNHLFWRGSHTENMEKQLQKWKNSPKEK